MKPFLLYLGFALLVSVAAQGQISNVMIGVNGLTCSQCSRNVEMQLRRLPFIADVKMNLEHTNGVLTIKPNSRLIPEAIAKSVKDAGFSLRYLKVTLQHPGQYISGDNCFSIGGLSFQLVATPLSGLPDAVALQFLGVPFQPKQESRTSFQRTCAGNNRVYFVNIGKE